ncbi:hypothetical protein, partial [Thiolapillus sp.]|uniref:hypothetical protein n=1 Tax=Thiolapillus sp. TaxID=2017437 RepID=UPI003AF8C956
SRSSQSTVMYTVPDGKINLNHIVGVCGFVAFEQNPVQGTLAALLVHSQSCRIKSTDEFELS